MARVNWFLVWCALFLEAYPLFTFLRDIMGHSAHEMPAPLFAANMALCFTWLLWCGRKNTPQTESQDTTHVKPRTSTRRLTLSQFLCLVGIMVLGVGILARAIVHRPSWIAIGLYAFAIPLALLNYIWLLGRAVTDMETGGL